VEELELHLAAEFWDDADTKQKAASVFRSPLKDYPESHSRSFLEHVARIHKTRGTLKRFRLSIAGREVNPQRETFRKQLEDYMAARMSDRPFPDGGKRCTCKNGFLENCCMLQWRGPGDGRFGSRKPGLSADWDEFWEDD